ncbi:TauD/TfdA family dioxygenase [Pigmentiphaga soli]|uniref:TauD/TfdA family dioxygenase n=1 Tax=Pigmentiphaga soli TaxID=1007095 RepID=A0ABP8HMQ6_9BURK
MSFFIRFADAPLGHEIVGVDLSHEIPDEQFAQIQDAYDRYGVIVFRGQRITPDQQIAFSRRFGPLDRYILERYNLKTHPEIFVVSNILGDDGQPIGLGDAGRYWHTDMWSIPAPPRGSLLYALEVPEKDGRVYGDTFFCSTQAAYDGLPPDLRRAIEGRQALYSTRRLVDFRVAAAQAQSGGALTQAEIEGMKERSKNMLQEITHPLVRLHPRTGRKCIYYSEGAISGIVDVPQAEAEQILEALRRHLLQPEFIYRHRWAAGDLVMWDNCSCIHKATGDFDLPLRRRMHRTTLRGTVPIPSAAGAAAVQ